MANNQYDIPGPHDVFPEINKALVDRVLKEISRDLRHPKWVRENIRGMLGDEYFCFIFEGDINNPTRGVIINHLAHAGWPRVKVIEQKSDDPKQKGAFAIYIHRILAGIDYSVSASACVNSEPSNNPTTEVGQ